MSNWSQVRVGSGIILLREEVGVVMFESFTEIWAASIAQVMGTHIPARHRRS
jgi:hypothetical protein